MLTRNEMLYWEKLENGRTYFYRADLSHDLFGRISVSRCWGVLDSHRGGHDINSFDSVADALRFLRMTRKRRKQHGYLSK